MKESVISRGRVRKAYMAEVLNSKQREKAIIPFMCVCAARWIYIERNAMRLNSHGGGGGDGAAMLDLHKDTNL